MAPQALLGGTPPVSALAAHCLDGTGLLAGAHGILTSAYALTFSPPPPVIQAGVWVNKETGGLCIPCSIASEATVHDSLDVGVDHTIPRP